MTLRESCFDGSFYPSDLNELIKYFNTFDEIQKIGIDQDIRAIIAPHAGYIYSGFSANLIYSNFKNLQDRRVIVIGPSHKVAFDGASISLDDEYQTPFGNLIIDKKYAQNLADSFDLQSYDSVHKEHSTEVQMPFIKYYCSSSRVIEIIYSDITVTELSKLITYLLNDPENIVVISTDLSHFHNLESANMLDSYCIEAIKKIDTSYLDRCEACGKIGVHALLISAKTAHLNSKIIDYRTSAWASNDTTRVVGYCSAIFY